jgi:uncharacterized membrane protein
MNTTERRVLWGRLETAGLVHGDLPQDGASPWYVRGMLGIGGWIGAIFFLGFIGIGFARVMESSGAAAVAAIVCSCGAYGIFRMAGKGAFAGQFGLALGLAGQALFAVAIFKPFRFEEAIGHFLLFAVAAVLTVVMPNFLHRIFTTLVAVTALLLGLAQTGLHGLALPLVATGCALVWRGEFRLAGRADIWQPVGYGLALGLVQVATTSLLGGELMHRMHRGGGGWLELHGAEVGTTLVALVFLAVVVHILRDLAIDPASSEGGTIIGCTVLAMAVSFPAHGLAAALLILILGFAGGNRVLFGLGLLALASFLSHYYYQMKETLLFKSMILAGAGVVLLTVRWGVRQLLPARGGKGDA